MTLELHHRGVANAILSSSFGSNPARGSEFPPTAGRIPPELIDELRRTGQERYHMDAEFRARVTMLARALGLLQPGAHPEDLLEDALHALTVMPLVDEKMSPPPPLGRMRRANGGTVYL